MAFDNNLPDIDVQCFRLTDWTKFYKNSKEAIPPNAQEPKGKAVNIYAFTDADYA